MESQIFGGRMAAAEATPRERLARILTLLGRVRLYWRSTLVLAVLGVGLSLFFALRAKRAWRSETTLLYRDAIVTAREGESASARAARLGPRLRDLVMARPRLTALVEELDLYPEKRARSMLEAVDELADNISFRARASDTFVVSFVHHDPRVAQAVTARLAELMIADHGRETLDTAKMTRDFLRRELEEASVRVDQASRALATFLAHNPQFQWGLNDNPYAPAPAASVPGIPPVAVAVAPTRPAAPRDPVLVDLESRLANIQAQIGEPSRSAVVASPAIEQAQRDRDAAAGDLAKAEAELAERMRVLTPAHPDAAAARARVDAARRVLATAEARLSAAKAAVARIDRAGAAPVSPERRAELEKDAESLKRQIAARRTKLARGDRGRSAGKEAGERASGSKDPSELEVVELETEWHRLKLDLERARDHLRAVQQSERAADISAAAAERKSQAEMMILDPAYLPSRPDRGRGRVFFVGVAITFLLVLGIAGARVLLNDTVFDAGDVVAAGAPPVLVALPKIPEDAEPAGPSTHAIVVTPVKPPTRAPRPSRTPGTTTTAGARPHPVTLPMLWGPPPAPRSDRPRQATLRFGSFPPAAELVRLEATLAPVLAQEAANEPEVEVVGTVVHLDDGGPEELLRRTPTAALASLRVLRHRLEQRRAGGRLVVSIVSPGSGEGKTLLAVRLALVLAEAERASVALVDANMVRPRVAAALRVRIPEPLGLSTQVRRRMTGGREPWRLVRLAPSLAVLAEPGPEPAFATALHSAYFDAALGALHGAYDFVVVDGPSVLASGDANVVEQVSDGILLVARSGATKGAELRRAAEQLGDRRILGVVLCDV